MLALFGPIKAEVFEGSPSYLKVKPERKLSRVPQIVVANVGGKAFRLKARPVDRDCDHTWIEVTDCFGHQSELRKALDELQERHASHRERSARVDDDYQTDERVLSRN